MINTRNRNIPNCLYLVIHYNFTNKDVFSNLKEAKQFCKEQQKNGYLTSSPIKFFVKKP